jgi:hypothetical protein
MQMTMTEPLLAGGITISAPTVDGVQLNMLLWGDSGSGKTTLAATAPGKKLFIMFDPGGELSLTSRSDVDVLNLSDQTATSVMTQFRGADPYTLGKVLGAHPEYETVVVDSMTALAYLALQEAVRMAGNSTLERPGIHGYAYRNALVLRITTAVMQLCAKHKRHLILITHEGTGDRNAEGVIQSVTMALSDGVANQVGLRFNEVWHVADTGTEHRIAVRPCRLRRPMKTRLFNATEPEFKWHYNPDTQVGDGIADWYGAWQQGGGVRLPLPGTAASTTSRGGPKK